MGHPPRRNPAPPRSAPGPATSAWPCPTAADSDPTSDKPGATRTASPEAETIEHTHTHTHTHFCQVQFECLEITEAATQNQTSDRLPGKKSKSRETRGLAEQWTYRYLAAAQAWAITEHPALQRISPGNPVESTDLDGAPAAPEPSTAEVRAWARDIGLAVPDRGRLRPDIRQAWRDAHRIIT